MCFASFIELSRGVGYVICVIVVCYFSNIYLLLDCVFASYADLCIGLLWFGLLACWFFFVFLFCMMSLSCNLRRYVSSFIVIHWLSICDFYTFAIFFFCGCYMSFMSLLIVLLLRCWSVVLGIVLCWWYFSSFFVSLCVLCYDDPFCFISCYMLRCRFSCVAT